MDDYSRPITPENAVNGIQVPGTPRNGLALTEYSANPSPPSDSSKEDGQVPESYLLPNGTPDYLRLILRSKVYDVVQTTPLTHATNLSNRLECKVLVKREDLQPVFSFKLRGAYNKMAHLSMKDRWKGVIACSAGMPLNPSEMTGATT
jgi:threonine dehydratase